MRARRSATGLGFANAWSYWITAWAGNAAIAVGWVLYVEVFINKGQTKIWSILLVLAGLWIPALINLSGIKNIGCVTGGDDDDEVRRAWRSSRSSACSTSKAPTSIRST